MTYTTIKWIKGNPYLYQVRSEREGDKVRQVFVRYLGRADRLDREEIERKFARGEEVEVPTRQYRRKAVTPVAEAVESPIEVPPETKGDIDVGDILINAEGRELTVEEWRPHAGFGIKGKFFLRNNRGTTSQLNAQELEERGYTKQSEIEAEAEVKPEVEQSETEYLTSLKSDIDRIESKYKETRGQIKSLESQSKDIFQQIVGNPDPQEKAQLEQQYRDINRELTGLRTGVKNTPSYIRQLKSEYEEKVTKLEPEPKPENIYLKMPIERVRRDAGHGVKAAQEALAELEAEQEVEPMEKSISEIQSDIEKGLQVSADELTRYKEYVDKAQTETRKAELAKENWVDERAKDLIQVEGLSKQDATAKAKQQYERLGIAEKLRSPEAEVEKPEVAKIPLEIKRDEERNTVNATFSPRQDVQVEMRTRQNLDTGKAEFDPSRLDLDKEAALIQETIDTVDDALESANMRKAIEQAFDIEWPKGQRPSSKAYVGAIITNDPKDAGMGSAGTGSAKVFWSPYSDKELYNESLREYSEMGVDGISTLAHEYHHALGGSGELDDFSEAVAANIHLKHNLELIRPDVMKQWIWSKTNSILRHPKSSYGMMARESLGFAREGNPALFDKLLDETGYPPEQLSQARKWIGTTTKKWKALSEGKPIPKEAKVEVEPEAKIELESLTPIVEDRTIPYSAQYNPASDVIKVHPDEMAKLSRLTRYGKPADKVVLTHEQVHAFWDKSIPDNEKPQLLDELTNIPQSSRIDVIDPTERHTETLTLYKMNPQLLNAQEQAWAEKVLSEQLVEAEAIAPIEVGQLSKEYGLNIEVAEAETTELTEIPYTSDLDIRNIQALPKGTGANYLVAIKGQGDELIAKKWARVKPAGLEPNEVLVDMKPPRQE